jgi:hypothetical protein
VHVYVAEHKGVGNLGNYRIEVNFYPEVRPYTTGDWGFLGSWAQKVYYRFPEGRGGDKESHVVLPYSHGVRVRYVIFGKIVRFSPGMMVSALIEVFVLLGAANVFTGLVMAHCLGDASKSYVAKTNDLFTQDHLIAERRRKMARICVTADADHGGTLDVHDLEMLLKAVTAGCTVEKVLETEKVGKKLKGISDMDLASMKGYAITLLEWGATNSKGEKCPGTDPGSVIKIDTFLDWFSPTLEEQDDEPEMCNHQRSLRNKLTKALKNPKFAEGEVDSALWSMRALEMSVRLMRSLSDEVLDYPRARLAMSKYEEMYNQAAYLINKDSMIEADANASYPTTEHEISWALREPDEATGERSQERRDANQPAGSFIYQQDDISRLAHHHDNAHDRDHASDGSLGDSRRMLKRPRVQKLPFVAKVAENFAPEDAALELIASKGDNLEVLRQDDDGWWLARNLAHGGDSEPKWVRSPYTLRPALQHTSAALTCRRSSSHLEARARCLRRLRRLLLLVKRNVVDGYL